MSDRSQWIWMPHPGHFICAKDCKFHLNTYVGAYIVSTVGEYWPDSAVREILANSRGIKLEGRGDAREADAILKLGYEKIGYDRLYETMVFKAARAEPGEGSLCCPWRIDSGSELDFAAYNDPDAAARGHLEMCDKWSRNG